ncbi:MAG: hypothetical protein HY791_19705 [Deltaproteobacteria bacterium]|nr:hypothetical protein [Deltaproteobacteria bacterium]
MARPRQVTDEQILDATRAAVLEKGAQVSLDFVAQRLGVTSPALIKRYGTRQNLMLQALCPREVELDEVFAMPIDDRPFVDQLASLVGRLAAYFELALPRVMALKECGVSHELIRDRIRLPMPVRAVAATTRWLTERREASAIESDALETAATSIVGAVTLRAIEARLTEKRRTSRARTKFELELARLVARGLGTSSTKRSRRGT